MRIDHCIECLAPIPGRIWGYLSRCEPCAAACVHDYHREADTGDFVWVTPITP
jgi:hypothetical protein